MIFSYPMASRFLFFLTSKTFVFVTNTSKTNLSAKISKTLTHFETWPKRTVRKLLPLFPSHPRKTYEILSEFQDRGGEKNKGEEGNACTFRSRYAVSRLRTENGSASVQPLKRWEFCVTRGQRADERRGEREREGELLLR